MTGIKYYIVITDLPFCINLVNVIIILVLNKYINKFVNVGRYGCVL